MCWPGSSSVPWRGGFSSRGKGSDVTHRTHHDILLPTCVVVYVSFIFIYNVLNLVVTVCRFFLCVVYTVVVSEIPRKVKVSTTLLLNIFAASLRRGKHGQTASRKFSLSLGPCTAISHASSTWRNLAAC